MARYIDAEALTAEFKRLTLGENSLIERVFADGVYAVIETFPAADVVPKSEVFLASSDAMKMLIECHGYYLTHDADVKREVAREIFEEIEREIKNHGITYAQRKIAELKKKYTEGEG